MTISVHTVLLLVAVVLYVLAALGVTSRVNLFYLAFAFVAAAFVW